jgi:hypothetical protein
MSGNIKGRVFFWVLAALALSCLGGCASGRYVILDVPTEPLKSFEVLEIKDCMSNPQEAGAIELAKGLGDQILEKIVAYNKENAKTPLFGTVTRATDRTDKVLEMRSVLQGYEKGSRAARYLIGFGAGKASCSVQCTFVDKSTGKQVMRAGFEGELSMGVVGGSAKQAAGKVLDKILEFLKKNY